MQSGCPSAITEDLRDMIYVHICENMCCIVNELHEVYPCISQSALYETVIVQLRYRKMCATWIPKMLTDEHKGKR
jgi:hypothetical protein